ncbi:MAG: aminotransferase class I/II-fold pyridoxal phosphate-dependent enzyme [Candidatus Eisenbacteria sp.]|nr:aminotransferase class I/II-fold pyridoxal phosphate-dependent enzyme [Candidatus Eisenbacteria bacterium]
MPIPLPIDMRSDTVTRPSAGMRRAMAEAEVGDDVFGDDPTVNRLQERVADLLGKEAALYVPSGTMANEVAIRALTEPGDEIITHRDSHIYLYEGGAPAALSGCSLRLLDGDRGLFDADAVRAALRADDAHMPRSRLVVIENTHNRGGGSVWDPEQLAGIRRLADDAGLYIHLDGARLMNACIARGVPAATYTQHVDTVAVCFSKGLGAPVGSAIAGSCAWIKRAHRARKMFGGGMRQAGIIAAGALYALDHNVERLAEDHAHAARLAEALAGMPVVTIDREAVETNIVYFDVDPQIASAADLCAALHEDGIWMLPIARQRVRAVTHLEVSREGIDHAISVLERILSARAGRARGDGREQGGPARVR